MRKIRLFTTLSSLGDVPDLIREIMAFCLKVTMDMTMVIVSEQAAWRIDMQTIKASEFKAKCLHLMDQVNHTGKEITITSAHP